LDRSNHYELAFAAYLRERRVGFVPVDDARRTLLGDADVKSLDFIVVDSARLVVDVKGRRFPGGSVESPRKVWQNWTEEEDVGGLLRWADHFGPGFRGVLAFVYHLTPPYRVPDDTPDLFHYRDRAYLVRGVEASEYRAAMRPRSRRWATVHLATADFRRLVRPFSDFLEERTIATPRTRKEEAQSQT
jgi:hypothetical protein